MKHNDIVEENVIKLTRIAHPQDQGEPTSKLKDAIREALTQAHTRGYEEGVERVVDELEIIKNAPGLHLALEDFISHLKTVSKEDKG